MDPDVPLKCHVCQEALDHTGRERPDWIADNDEGCYDMSQSYLEDCPLGVTHCMTSLNVDWYIGGAQFLKFKRSCGLPGESLSNLKCQEDFVPPIAYKGTSQRLSAVRRSALISWLPMRSAIFKWKLLPSEYFALLIIHIDKPLVSDKVVELEPRSS